jgi:alkylation response protein AidB-like acyl-CoA dehydrogenase
LTSAIASTQLLAQAAEAAATIRERAAEADRARRLAPETLADLHRAGLMALPVPASEGGGEASMLDQTKVFEVIAGACASTAWCLINHSALLPLARGLMPRSAGDTIVAEVVADGPFIAHATVPAGDPTPVEGGYRLSGRWPFISGSLLARWAILSTMVAGPDGQPENRWMTVRLDDPAVRVEETWEAMSVRASMSHDVVVEDAFVPGRLDDGRALPARLHQAVRAGR